MGHGTWLGINKQGRISNLLNIPEKTLIPHAPSRGAFTITFALRLFCITAFAGKLVMDSLVSEGVYRVDNVRAYNGFKLINIDALFVEN